MSPARLADVVALVHVLYVLAAVVPVPLILVGGLRRWSFVRRPGFRAVHLVMVAFVAAESLLGAACPLTVWENGLREQAGQPAHPGSFIGYWLDRFLYYDLPLAWFTIAYVAFSLIVIALWFLVPPRRRVDEGRQ